MRLPMPPRMQPPTPMQLRLPLRLQPASARGLDGIPKTIDSRAMREILLWVAFLSACDPACPAPNVLQADGRCVEPGDSGADAAGGDACAAGAEICNGRDDDCDGRTDEGVTRTYHADGDGDGYGLDTDTVQACAAPPGHSPDAGDCDDTASAVHPGAAEICNGADDDCDGVADQTFACVRGASSACTTSCGSAGTGTCTATCALAAAADCAPPPEACNGVDDDCDGFVDDGVQHLGPRIDLGAATGRLVVLPTDLGFVAVMARSTGIWARRLDPAGAVVGSDVQVTPVATDVFDAWSTGPALVVAWMTGALNIDATVLSSALAVTTPTRSAVVGISDFTTRLEVVASGSQVLFLNHDGSDVRATGRSFPGLTGATVGFALRTGAQVDFDAILEPSGPRVLAVGSDLSDDIWVASALLGSAIVDRSLSLTATASPQRSPRVAWAMDPVYGPQIAVTWHDDPTGTASDRVRLAFVDVAADGRFTARGAAVDLASAGPPDGRLSPLAVSASGGLWRPSRMQLATAPASTWLWSELAEQSGAGPAVSTASVETVSATNVALSSAPGAGGTFLFAASTSTAARAYLLGCL